MRSYDKSFDSSEKDEALFTLASGHISTTVLFFPAQQLYAVIQAEGHVAFFDAQDTPLCQVSVPKTGGKGKYMDLRCTLKAGRLVLAFPSYRWYDNYPYCDGESDRWDAIVTGWPWQVVFDPETGTAALLEE